MPAYEYIVIRKMADDEVRVCPVAAGFKPTPEAGYTWGGPYKSQVAALNAIASGDERLRRQLYPDKP